MTGQGEGEAEELIAAVERWERSGGVWRVLGRGPDGVTVSLLRCDGGEEVGQLVSARPAWIAFLERRAGSES